jgi:23S rRNA pseudouridine1911/1915/1917 synthase
VIGDPVYGPGPLRLPGHVSLEQALRTFPRQALHAEELRFQHPESGSWLMFMAPLPADMTTLLGQVRESLSGAVPSPAGSATVLIVKGPLDVFRR